MRISEILLPTCRLLVRRLSHVSTPYFRTSFRLTLALLIAALCGLSNLSLPFQAASLATSANLPAPAARRLRTEAGLAAAVLVNPVPVTTVSAASYELTAIAPEAIVAAFGTQLATAVVTATDADPNTPGIQLPTEL